MPIRLRAPSTVVALAALAPVVLMGAGCDAGPRVQPASRGGPAAEATVGATVRGVSEAASAGFRATPVATSLLGEPLYPLVMDSATETRLAAQLDSAEAAHEARPDDPDALIWLGRRLAYLGHYREAIAVFTEGIEAHPDDARFYRHRGHRFITVRELDRAIADLELAARLISGATGSGRGTLSSACWTPATGPRSAISPPRPSSASSGTRRRPGRNRRPAR